MFFTKKAPFEDASKLVIMSLRGIANGDAVAISRKGIRFLFSPVAPTFIVFYITVNMTHLPNI